MQDNESQVKSTSQMLEEGLDEVFSTEYYRRFLAFVAGNPNYSYRNVILILQQCPHATLTKGIRTWNKEGRRIRTGETGLRINACFDKDEDEEKDRPPVVPSKRKRKSNSRFRRVSVFDVSQTTAVNGSEDDDGNAPQPARPMGNILGVAPLMGSVAGFDTLLADLKQLAPLPIQFRDNINVDGGAVFNAIIIKEGMSQLHTIRTIINQIAQLWLSAGCHEQEQLEIESESVAFIVSRYLGLDTSAFSFQHIAKYSLGRERNVLERFLDVIQKTALYFIDTVDGIRAARRIGYANDDYFLFTNQKTAFRLFRQGYDLYMIYPKDGELLVMSKKQLELYDGPFAVLRMDWFGASGKMAA